MTKNFAKVLLMLMTGSTAVGADLGVVLNAGVPSPQSVGTPVIFTAVLSGQGSESAQYRFEVRATESSKWNLIRDYTAFAEMRWTTLDEGLYEFRVTARTATVQASSRLAYAFSTRTLGGTPVVSATAHPLVAIYSTPPCLSGNQMRVRFQADDGTSWQTTPTRNCIPGKSLNFFIAGMRARRRYQIQQELITPTGIVRGFAFNFLTGAANVRMPAFTFPNPAGPGTNFNQSIVLHTFFGFFASDQLAPMATDLTGEVLWYYKEMDSPHQFNADLTRPVPGGNMLLLSRFSYGTGQILREIDLAGNTVKETSATQIGEQLVLQGKDPINRFHHEAVRLPNGHTLVLGSVEKILINEQGPGPVNVVGDMVIDLDENFQVVWSWNSFEHLDRTRKAVLGEMCANNVTCGPLSTPFANDWTHTNTIDLTADGNLLLSMRHQDWILKINYQNGTGDGRILWRMGSGGDFSIVSTDPWPWFSHAHDTRFDGQFLVVYDNGNTRVTQTGRGNSRGQAYLVDETRRIVTPVLNADLGLYSPAFGSAQRLTNGNFFFGSGNLGRSSVVTELKSSGFPNYVGTANNLTYRAFRMKTLYSIQ